MKITDARIGMKVAANNGFPMIITGIFTTLPDLNKSQAGTVYLDFEGNEGDVWEEDVKDIEPIK